MKKIYSLIFLCTMSCLAMAQAQRMILAEEFTQASCPPCASQNPAFNQLCDDNYDKVIGLHYQVSWPGVDPMYNENPTQVDARVSYYGVSSVPYAFLDGVPQTGAAYTGAPYNWTQGAIDNEYAVPSPFSLNVSHTFSSDYDSIFITVNIQAAQAFTSTSAMRLHVAIVERNIHFTSAPGSNGETDFFWVMRRMLPSENGTSLGLTWTNAQTQTVTLSYPLPWYIRNINQVGVVSFIQQSNSTHTVLQAAYSAPTTVATSANDVSAPFVNIPVTSCNPVAPTVTLRNMGTATLTSANINYQFDVASNWFYTLGNTFAWSGSIAPGASTLVTLPSVSLTGSGQHTMTVNANSPNGAVDINPYNGYKSSAAFFAYPNVGSTTPVGEGFQAILFPPSSWMLYNPDNSYGWTRYPAAGGFGNSTSSAKMNFYFSPNNQVDDLILPAADLQWATPGINLTFSVAYAQKGAENDHLAVQISTNCGVNWTTVYDKSGSVLSTHTPYSTGAWIPTASDWRSDTVNLNSYIGSGDVLIRFRATSNAGNNLYLDDVNLQFVTGISQPLLTNDIDVYPNPTNGILNFNLNSVKGKQVTVKIFNSLGEVVLEKEIENSNSGTCSLNLSELPAGNYITQIISDKNSSQYKISLQK